MRWSHFFSLEDACRLVTLVPRVDWEAEVSDVTLSSGPATVLYVNMTNTRYCSDTESCGHQLSMLQRQDKADGHEDVNYSFVIGFTGNVLTGRGFNTSINPLPQSDGENGLLIGLFGRATRNAPPPPLAMVAAARLLVCGVENGSITKDVKIRHVERKGDPCRHSLADRLQRVIRAMDATEPAFASVFECVNE